jgi:MFS family permease
MKKWSVLLILSAAQFLMVLDAAVMNVSISQLVEDFDTDVTTIQAVITFYSLVMAALMITGGKVGDIIGRKRVFLAGHVIYGAGSFLTAISWSVPALLAGWSVLEGIGAAMVMPALAALAGGIYQGRDRALVYGVLGGVSGVGIAVGPILGGFMTTYYSWRLVFAGEVIVAIGIIVGTLFLIKELPREKEIELDWVGSVLCASGLGLMVFGVLQASTWGWIQPHNSPIEPFGLALTPFVVAAGAILMWCFRAWQGYREERGRDPLVHLRLFDIKPLRSGLAMFLAQNTIMMGIFFVIPLYLQIVQGFNAFDTGVKMLPISVMLFISALGGSVIARRAAGAGPYRSAAVGGVVAASHCGGCARVGQRSVRDCIGNSRARSGPDLFAARQCCAVRSGRERPERGGRSAVHEHAARVVAGHCPYRRSGDNGTFGCVREQREQ